MSEAPERPVERLLRETLEARAAAVGPGDLRPADPPRVRQLPPRRRLAVVLPLAGLAAAAAGAFGYLGLSGAFDPEPRVVSPAHSAAAEPTPTPAPGTTSASPSASPTSSPAGSSSASSSASSSSGPPAAVVSVPPGAYVASAWLVPRELPLAGTFHWTGQGSRPTFGNGPFQGIYSCGGVGPEQKLHTRQIGVLSYTGANNAQAAQWTFYFQDQAAAATAMDRVVQDYAGCTASHAQETDVTTGKPLHWVVTRTATGSGGFAYRTEIRDASGRPGLTNSWSPDIQELWVRQGNVVLLVQVQGQGTALDQAAGAPATLSAMAAALAGYTR